MIGGAQGTGVDSSANIFARACGAAGLYVFGKREYYSNIKGEHSYFSVVASSTPVRSHMDEVHLLATFDSETVVRHAWEVVPGGGIIYDTMGVGEKVTNIPTLEKPVVEAVLNRLSEDGLGNTLKDVLEVARRNGVSLFPIPYLQLLKEIGSSIGVAQLSVLSRMTNVMAVAASFAIMRFPLEYMDNALSQVFRTKQKVVKMNVEAVKATEAYVERTFDAKFPLRLSPAPTSEERILINGTSAVALGKIVAGCTFQTYYPITPASDESVYLEDHEVFNLHKVTLVADNPHHEESTQLDGKGSIIVVQTEDEIAAITMATGAALAGARAATATSGPGFSLMSEGSGWAGMNEVPVVITLYQRGGPSTGLPTRHEQGDLLFSLHAGHGEFPRLVLASGDIEEAFYDTVKAFNYAERYQTPVIHILDKALANSTATLPRFSYGNMRIDRGKLLKAWDRSNGEYQRFSHSSDGISARVPLGSSGAVFWNTGDEHDELGHISEDPTNRVSMMDKRMRKLETADKEIPDSERVYLHGNSDAPYVIISWGSPKGAILDAVEHLSEKGLTFAFAQVRLLHPFPTRFLGELLPKYKKIICVEQNYSGQFAILLRARTGLKPDSCILKYNGRPFSFSELRDALPKAAVSSERRIVTNAGA